MHGESRKTVHLGVNYLFTPQIPLSSDIELGFLRMLGEHGVEYSSFQKQDSAFVVTMGQGPIPLMQISVASNPHAPTAQLLIIAPNVSNPIELLEGLVEAVINAFLATWPAPYQVLQHDITIRDLYDTSSEHAFMELWEQRLKQSPDALAMLGDQILGGGLRLVLPPAEDRPLTELKIESFMQDTTKLFVETQCIWQQTIIPLDSTSAKDHIAQVNNFIETKVSHFIQGG